MASDAAKRMLARYKALGQTESVVYKPKGGTQRTIDALVQRLSFVSDLGALARSFQVTVLNDAVLGVSAATAIDDGDTVALAEVVGRTAVDRLVTVSPETDTDWIVLEAH